ncbi:tetratricopeptide repeat protein [Desulfovibrio mangrovi]|uniref:tetratricopeptide repeat protein n=1 Tax=Desulfovibrio mangrovi TaxID=2976983 RepID=UPI0022457D0A|nr:tetratricopeptide repeat protein [Desulfovibrio mangrovi]UZP69018.1 tetratricopeptide repeat protein [Desulfovibrio mangrovi]
MMRFRENAPKVVLVTARKEHEDQDKAAIARQRLALGASFASGMDAFGYLCANPCDLILCDSNIGDMDSRSFLRLLKKNATLKHVPVVMVTAENDRNAVLDAIAAGCAGYILRPYSVDTFERHVGTALKLTTFTEIEEQQISDAKQLLAMGRYDDAIEEFEEILALHEEAQQYYDMGCRYLLKQKYGKAIVSFNKALKINELFAEAYQGLAEAFRGKGDMEQYKRFLKRAADTYAQFDRLEEVKELFIDILKVDSTAANPFNTLGVKLRRNGDLQGAVRAYLQALEISPSDENIYFNLSKAYCLLEERDKGMEALVTALRINSGFEEARDLYGRMAGQPWTGEGFDDLVDKVGRSREGSGSIVDL